MQKLLSIVITVILLSSCYSRTIALKGNYPEMPIKIHTEKNFEDVWGNLIDLFAQNGLSIKIIDKNSGLIVSDKSDFPATSEDKSGKLVNPSAFIVMQKFYDVASAQYRSFNQFSKIYGEWNVRVKKEASGCTINVNMVNLYWVQHTRYGNNEIPLTKFKSTGVFENAIANLIK